MDDPSPDRPDPGMSDAEVEALLTRLDGLLERLEAIPGPGTGTALEAIESLTEVYGAALARVVAMVARGSATLRSLADDELLGHLLTLHGLHPDPPEQRIAGALQDAAPALLGHGSAELAGITDGVARVRYTVTGCATAVGGPAGSTAESLRDVVLAAAPELAGVEPQAVQPPAEPAFIPADALLRRPGAVR